LSPAAAEALKQAGEKPLVLGPSPQQVHPRLGAWPAYRCTAGLPGHLLALRIAARPPADLLAQLASLGWVEQVVWVTRLSQTLSQSEREALATFATLAAASRVLVVGLPSEEASEVELAEVTARATEQLRRLHFGQRNLGAVVWFAGEKQPRPGAIADLAEALALRDGLVAAGRIDMFRWAVANILAEVRWKVEQAPQPPLILLDDAERQRLTAELGRFLADLGREVERQAKGPRPPTADNLRTYALDAVRGWGAYITIEGHWLKFVERLRPGAQDKLLAETEAALVLLDHVPPAAQSPLGNVSTNVTGRTIERVLVEAKRGLVGLACGATGAWAVTAIPGLPGLVVTLLSAATFVLIAILGYGAARTIFRLPLAATAAPAATWEPPPASGVLGWSQIERRLTSWFAQWIQAKPITSADECRRLAARFGIEEHAP
jgi:hypothetical protein